MLGQDLSQLCFKAGSVKRSKDGSLGALEGNLVDGFCV